MPEDGQEVDEIARAISSLAGDDQVILVRALMEWALHISGRPEIVECLEISQHRERWHEGRRVFETTRKALLEGFADGSLSAVDEALLLLVESAAKTLANADGSGRYDDDVAGAAVDAALAAASGLSPDVSNSLQSSLDMTWELLGHALGPQPGRAGQR
jgi:hypothetical protein